LASDTLAPCRSPGDGNLLSNLEKHFLTFHFHRHETPHKISLSLAKTLRIASHANLR